MTVPYGLLNAPGEHGDYAGNSPSAILSMLQGMAAPPVQQTPGGPPGAPMPAPQAAPLPPQAPAEKPHMLQRIVGLLGSLGGSAVDTVKGIGDMKASSGYNGLLTPDEIQGAKPGRLYSILDALGGGKPAAEYQGNLNNILAMHGMASQLAEQKRLDGVRANMAAMFTPKPGASNDEIRDLNEKMFAYAIRNNDPATAKLLETSNVESIKRPKAFAALHEVPGVGLVDVTDPANPKTVVKAIAPDKNKQIVNAQEGVFEMRPDGLYDAATGAKYTGKTVHPISLAPSYTPVTVGGGEDKPGIIKAFNTKTGEADTTIGEAKPATTRVESATNTAAKARLQAAVSEMNNAHKGMAEFEQKLKDGKISIGGLSQFMGATANSFTHDDPASRVIQTAALATLNRTNPELARYIRRGLSFAEGESMVSQRPSDFRTKMAAFLSTAASGASNDMISDIESRRTSILNPLNETVKPAARSTTAPATTGGPPSYEDWKKANKIP